MSFTKCPTPPPKRPQSIVHRFGRISSSIALPFSNKSEKKNSSKKKKEKKTRNSKSVKKFYKNSESSSSNTVASSTMKELSIDYVSDEDYSEGSLEDNLRKCNIVIDDDEEGGEEEDFFVSLDQNEFLVECFMTNECSDVTFIVHFHAEDSALSEHIEDVILIRTMESGSNCQCRRVNSRLTPLFTAKLGIDPEQPTIVAIRNGAVVDRISDISSGCWELERWLADTGILMKKPDRNVFPNMNVHSC